MGCGLSNVRTMSSNERRRTRLTKRIPEFLFIGALQAFVFFLVSVALLLVAHEWNLVLVSIVGRLFIGYILIAVVGGLVAAVLAPLTRYTAGVLFVGALVGVVSTGILTVAVLGDAVRWDTGLLVGVVVTGVVLGAVGGMAIKRGAEEE